MKHASPIIFLLASAGLAGCAADGAPSASAPSTRQAELSATGMPVTITEFMDWAGKISSAYSSAKTALDVLNQVNVYLGLDQPPPDAFQQLTIEVDLAGASATAKASETIVGDAITEAELGLHDLKAALDPTTSTAELPQRRVDADDHTFNAVNRLLQHDVYMRMFAEAVTNDSNNGVCCAADWKKAIPASSRPTPDGFAQVYDWRLGIPGLMEAIALRITAIAGLNPDFRNNANTQAEFMGYREALLQHYQTMLSGIQCNQVNAESPLIPIGVHDTCYHACADVYTGIAQSFTDSCDPLRLSGDWSGVARMMPFFQMRAMIDTLYDYANPGSDSIASFHNISLDSGYFCATVRNVPTSDPITIYNPGNYISFELCNGDSSQEWIYDRQQQTVVNPASNGCLDVATVLAGLQHGGGFWDSPFGVMDCSLGKTLWTYDAHDHILQSANGPYIALALSTGSQGMYASLMPRASVDSSFPVTSTPFFATTLDPTYYASTRYDIDKVQSTGARFVEPDGALFSREQFGGRAAPSGFWGQDYDYLPLNGVYDYVQVQELDWAFFAFKGQCASGQALTGLSAYSSGQEQAHTILCGDSVVNSNTYISYHSAYFDSRLPASPWDWDFGNKKAECPPGHYVQGVSQSTDGEMYNLLCAYDGTLAVTPDACSVEPFGNGNGNGTNSTDYVGPDWDYGYYKGQCPSGFVVAGISSNYLNGPIGAPHALLCCPP